MDLTASEQRAFRAVVKRQRRWQWYRYVCLFVGCAIIGVALWSEGRLVKALLDATRQMSWRESPTGAEVFFASTYGGLIAFNGLLLPMLGGLIIAMTLGWWRGNPVDQLLIALVSRATGSPGESGQAP